MKKLLIVLALIASTVVLIGCGRDPELNTPENLRREEEVLRWDSVRGASHYIVRVNETQTFEVTETEFDLELLAVGMHSVDVRAASDTLLSPYSDSLTVSISRTFPYPVNLEIDGDTLIWESVDADSYRIWIDGNIHATVEETSYTFTDLEPNASYTVRVQAVFGQGVSDPSPSVKYHFYTDVVQRFNFKHSIHSSNSPLLTLKYISELVSIEYEENLLDTNQITLTGHLLELERSFLNNLDVGVHVFLVTTSFGVVEVVVEVVDSVTPRITGGPNFYYQPGQDIVIRYDLFAGEIDVNTTTESITDREIVISADYLESLLVENPSRTNYIFSIVIEHGENETIIAFINIILQD